MDYQRRLKWQKLDPRMIRYTKSLWTQLVDTIVFKSNLILRNTTMITIVFFAGNHVLISLSNEELYYLHSSSHRPKKLSAKLSGLCESVAFMASKCTTQTTKSFLLGTNEGIIYEMEIESTGREKMCQIVYRLNFSSSAIASLCVESQDERMIVLFTATNPSRLYHYTGSDSFENVFSRKSKEDNKLGQPFIEIPSSNSLSTNRLPTVCTFASSATTNSFAVLTPVGVYTGPLRFADLDHYPISDVIQNEAQMIDFPFDMRNKSSSSSVQSLTPISLAATHYHFMMLSPSRVQILSRISSEVVQDESIRSLIGTASGTPLGIVRDYVSGSTWMYTTSSIFEFIMDEEKDIWRVHLSKAVSSGDDRLFEETLSLCTKEQRYEVYRVQAEMHFRRGDIEKAAKLYALTNLTFDTVVLQILDAKHRLMPSVQTKDHLGEDDDDVEEIRKESLLPTVPINPGKSLSGSFLPFPLTSSDELTAVRFYVEEVLRILPLTAKCQRTMLCTWLCELYVHQIATLTLANDIDKDLMNKFQEFLRQHRSSLDPAITMKLIASRGLQPLIVFYAQLIGDYDKVIYFYLNDRRYNDAVTLLSDAPFELVENLIYKTSPALIEAEPEATIAMMSSKPKLVLNKCLPALLRYCEKIDACHANDHSLEMDYEGRHVNFAVKYVEDRLTIYDNDYFVNGDQEKRKQKCDLYQLYIFLLAKYDTASEEKLVSILYPLLDEVSIGGTCDEDVLVATFIARCKESGNDANKSIIPFDVEFALNVCNIYKRNRSCVLLNALLGHFEEAVTRATEFDVQLAQEMASKPSSLVEKKHLWRLIISKLLVGVDDRDKNGIVMDSLKASDGILQIEDVLEYMSDVNDIDQFKDEICTTLENFSSKIEGLRGEMHELAESTESIVSELEVMKKRGYGFSTVQKCEYCNDAVFARPFYMFPCSHGYHSDCIMKRLSEHLEPVQVESVKGIQEKLKIATKRAQDLDRRAMIQQEYLQNEIDGYIAAECPLCGDAMVRSIGKSLINEETKYEELRFWAI